MIVSQQKINSFTLYVVTKYSLNLVIVVNIGFQSLEFISEENSSAVATVCAQIDRGTLERYVDVYLTSFAAIGDTAVGTLHCIIKMCLISSKGARPNYYWKN